MNYISRRVGVCVSSHDIPASVLKDCAIAVGVVLAHKMPSNILPLVVANEEDDFLGDSYDVVHTIQERA